MSPEQWQELAERAYGAWAANDRERFISALAPEIVFHTSGAFPDFTGDYSGHEGMRRFWDEMQEPWESFDIALVAVEAFSEDLAVVDIRFRGIGRGSGVPAELDFFHVARASGDRIAELSAYADRGAALTAHGLRPPE